MEETRCPYLGLLHDPETALAFPSERNCCHRGNPVEAVILGHQISHCFTAAHTHCPVFSRSIEAPLPPELQVSPQQQVPRKIAIGGIASIVLLIAVLLLVIMRGEGADANVPLLQNSAQDQQAEAAATLTALSPALISPTQTAIIPQFVQPSPTGQSLGAAQPSATPEPSSTACPIPEGWLVIVVAESDTLGSLAKVYDITIRELASGNCLEVEKLIPGSILYVPLLKPEPSVTTQPSACSPPAGWIKYIVQSGDTLSKIGQIYGVTVSELQQANCMGTSTTIQTGQSLYVPNKPGVSPQPPSTAAPIPTNTEEPIPTSTPTTEIQPPSATPTLPPTWTPTSPPPTETSPPPTVTSPPPTDKPPATATPRIPPPTPTPRVTATPTPIPIPPTATSEGN